VLNQNNRRPVATKRPDTIEKTIDFGRIETSRRLVDQQELRFCCECARKFEHPLLAIRQRSGKHMKTRRHANEMQQLHGAFAAPLLIDPESRTVRNVLPRWDLVVNMKSRDHILQHAELLEQADLLKGPGDAKPHAPMRGQGRQVRAIERQ
jgi:hypothetical protein